MGSAASVETSEALKEEAQKPLDGSDLASADDAVAEVKRLRSLLHHMSTVTDQESKGLEVVWGHLSDGGHTIDLATLCQAHQKMTNKEVTEDGMKLTLKELDVAENAIDFENFVRIFALRKKHKGPVQFDDIDKAGKGEITAADLSAAVRVRPTFAGMDFGEEDAQEIIALASPTSKDKLARKDFEEVQKLLDKKKAVYSAFKLWDNNGDGQVDIRDILQTLKSHGEEMTMEEAKEILAEVDKDKDGVINFKDFQAAIERPSFDELQI